MMFELKQNLDTGDIIVRFSDKELSGKTVAYAMDIIATRLADEFMQKHGEEAIKIIDIESIKDEVQALVKDRLVAIAEQSKDDN